ncbi:hypothetical protein B0F90DRAFT_1668068 [Multifurca ochricompacta]|uniref:Uncharacterized protein n=1 Tax=Multifurca ochricompacta TaxID=376703 RepID=A0AAD4M3Z9_9AGAM|nr:hypothetical protein B0F90DRAFT_1668068 [Multifurca ochricompacta]
MANALEACTVVDVVLQKANFGTSLGGAQGIGQNSPETGAEALSIAAFRNRNAEDERLVQTGEEVEKRWHAFASLRGVEGPPSQACFQRSILRPVMLSHTFARQFVLITGTYFPGIVVEIEMKYTHAGATISRSSRPERKRRMRSFASVLLQFS